MHLNVGVDTIFRKIPVLEVEIIRDNYRQNNYAKIGGHFEKQDGGNFQFNKIETSSFITQET